MLLPLGLLAAAAAEEPSSTFSSAELVELMPYVGNGFLATHPIVGARGGVAGAYAGQTIFLGGVFNAGQFSQNRSHRAAIPGFSTEVAPPSGAAAETTVEYELDVRRAVLSRRWAAGSLTVTEEHYAHRTRRNLLVHTIALENRGPALQLGVSQRSGPECGGPYGCDVSLSALPGNAGVRLLNGSTLESETPESPLTTIAMASTTLPKQLRLGAGANRTLLLLSSLSSSLESSQPVDTATRALSEGTAAGAQQLLAEHAQAWSVLWESGAEVEGDEGLACAINGSLYFILSSIRDDWDFGLSPGGLASGGYHGHTFWDQETWMWPPLLMWHPDLARSALRYRFNRRAAATELANHYGHVGLRFPWESALTGVEAETGSYGHSGRKDDLAGCSVWEIHISVSAALPDRSVVSRTD